MELNEWASVIIWNYAIILLQLFLFHYSIIFIKNLIFFLFLLFKLFQYYIFNSRPFVIILLIYLLINFFQIYLIFLYLILLFLILINIFILLRYALIISHFPEKLKNFWFFLYGLFLVNKVFVLKLKIIWRRFFKGSRFWNIVRFINFNEELLV